MSELAGALLGLAGWALVVLGACYVAFPVWPSKFRLVLSRGLAVGAVSSVAAGLLCLLAFAGLTVLLDLIQLGTPRGIRYPVFFDMDILMGISAFTAVLATIIAITGKDKSRSTVNWTKNGICAVLAVLGATAVRFAYSTHHPRVQTISAVALIACCFTMGATIDWPFRDLGIRRLVVFWTLALSLVAVSLALLAVAPDFLRTGAVTEGLMLIAIGLFGYTFCSPPHRLTRQPSADRGEREFVGFALWLEIGLAIGIVWSLVWHNTNPTAGAEYAGIPIAMIVSMAHEHGKRFMNSSRVKVIASSELANVRYRFRLNHFLDRAWRAAIVGTAYLGLFYGIVTYVMYLTGSLPSTFTTVPVSAFVVFAVLAGMLMVGPTGGVIGALYGAAGLPWFVLPRLKDKHFAIAGLILTAVGVTIAERADWLALWKGLS